MKAADLKNLNLSDLISRVQTADWRNIGSWPLVGRIVILAIAFVVILGLGWYFLISDQKQQLDQAAQQEVQLKQQFEQKAMEAANLDILKAQLEEMKKSFGTMLRQLPGKTEIPNLLQDISQTAQVDGLKQDLFKPTSEVRKDFYAEQPIQIAVEGSYHQFAKFVSDVAALPRIVTIHDVNIKPSDSAGVNLVMTLTAKTYRYLEAGEEAAAKPSPGVRK